MGYDQQQLRVRRTAHLSEAVCLSLAGAGFSLHKTDEDNLWFMRYSRHLPTLPLELKEHPEIEWVNVV